MCKITCAVHLVCFSYSYAILGVSTRMHKNTRRSTCNGLNERYILECSGTHHQWFAWDHRAFWVFQQHTPSLRWPRHGWSDPGLCPCSISPLITPPDPKPSGGSFCCLHGVLDGFPFCSPCGYIAAVCKGKQRCLKCGSDHRAEDCRENVQDKCYICCGQHGVIYGGFTKSGRVLWKLKKWKQFTTSAMQGQRGEYWEKIEEMNLTDWSNFWDQR